MTFDQFSTRVLTRELREKLTAAEVGDDLRFLVPQLLIGLFEDYRKGDQYPPDAMNAVLWCMDATVESDALDGLVEGLVFFDEARFKPNRPIYVSNALIARLFDDLCVAFDAKEATYDDYRAESISHPIWEKETKRWRAATALRLVAALPKAINFVRDDAAAKHFPRMRRAFTNDVGRLSSVAHVRSVQRDVLALIRALLRTPWRMREEIAILVGFLSNKGLSNVDYILTEPEDQK